MLQNTNKAAASVQQTAVSSRKLYFLGSDRPLIEMKFTSVVLASLKGPNISGFMWKGFYHR